MRILIFILLLSNTVFGQKFKNDISVVQFSAGFVKDSEVKLTPFEVYNVYYFTMEERAVLFKEEDIRPRALATWIAKNFTPFLGNIPEFRERVRDIIKPD